MDILYFQRSLQQSRWIPSTMTLHTPFPFDSVHIIDIKRKIIIVDTAPQPELVPSQSVEKRSLRVFGPKIHKLIIKSFHVEIHLSGGGEMTCEA